jgi:HesB-like selenoprotein
MQNYNKLYTKQAGYDILVLYFLNREDNKMIFIDEQAYKEFKELLDENNVASYNIRVAIGGYSCRGPVFDVMVDNAGPDDDVEIINEITFIVEKKILEEFGGFTIVSSAENNGNGVGLKPVVMPSSSCGDGCGDGCGSCGGGCH